MSAHPRSKAFLRILRIGSLPQEFFRLEPTLGEGCDVKREAPSEEIPSGLLVESVRNPYPSLNGGLSLLVEVVIELEVFLVHFIGPVFDAEDADGGLTVAELDGVDEALVGVEVHGFPFVGVLAEGEVVEAAAQGDKRLFEEGVFGEGQEDVVETDVLLVVIDVVVFLEQVPLLFVGSLEEAHVVGGELVEDFVEAVGLDGADDLVGALDEAGGDGVDVDALAGEDGHKALGLEADEGVAQGGLAHLKGFADAVLIQKFAVAQLARAHGVLEILIDALAQGVRFRLLLGGCFLDCGSGTLHGFPFLDI